VALGPSSQASQQVSRRERHGVLHRHERSPHHAGLGGDAGSRCWVIGGRNGAAVRLGLKRTTSIANMRKPGISRDTEGQRADRCDAAFDQVCER
jgi:hypothetical protein